MRRFLRPCWLLPVLAVFLMAWAQPVSADEAEFHARLIWGTDEMKPDGKHIREMDEKTKEKLKNIFKWKNYFEVEAQDFKIAANEVRKIKMSSKCDVEVHSLGKDGFEVMLFGQGQLVKKLKQQVPLNEHVILAGDDRNASAWFVILTRAK